MPTYEDIARVCHEANRALQVIGDDTAPSPAWDEAPEWQRDSAIEGVKAAIGGATPVELHRSWCDHKRADGWVYGPVKDEHAKTHPCLVAYADLPESQRLKDYVFGAIVQALTKPITPGRLVGEAARAALGLQAIGDPVAEARG